MYCLVSEIAYIKLYTDTKKKLNFSTWERPRILLAVDMSVQNEVGQCARAGCPKYFSFRLCTSVRNLLFGCNSSTIDVVVLCFLQRKWWNDQANISTTTTAGSSFYCSMEKKAYLHRSVQDINSVGSRRISDPVPPSWDPAPCLEIRHLKCKIQHLNWDPLWSQMMYL